MEDTSMKSRMSVMLNTSKESAQALEKMDEEVNYLSSSTRSDRRLIASVDFASCPIFKQLPSETNFPAILCR
jgi:hypothetical protein